MGVSDSTTKPPRTRKSAERQKHSSADLRVSEFELGEARYVVLSYSLAPDSALKDLTAAERDVVRRALAGFSNAVIAEARGTSARTVANQLAAVYRRLGVSSRAELATLLQGRARHAPH